MKTGFQLGNLDRVLFSPLLPAGMVQLPAYPLPQIRLRLERLLAIQAALALLTVVPEEQVLAAEE